MYGFLYRLFHVDHNVIEDHVKIELIFKGHLANYLIHVN